MTTPLYASNAAPGQPCAGANAGLWFTRFYNAFAADWTVPSEGKSEWINTTSEIKPSAAGIAALDSLVERQKALCAAMQGQSTVLTTTAPLATGLGLSHPVENGFAFHPTLGCAYLPASGVKGLLRAWMEVWAETQSDKSALMKHWFGTSHDDGLITFEKDDQKHSAGCLIFFDALPAQWPDLACDIMTPHMGKWYENGGKIDAGNFAATAPADWHSPVPIPFMTVKTGAKFLLAIAPRLTGDAEKDDAARAAAADALEQLKLALEWLGAGAKTATGYGRMHDASQNMARELAKSGVANGQTEWPNAILEWNKGKGQLTVRSEDKKSAAQAVSGPEWKAWIEAHPQKKKLFDNKRVEGITAVVDVLGSRFTLIALK